MGYPTAVKVAAYQVVAPVFDWAAAAQLGAAVRLEAGRLHSERLLEAVLEVVAPAQGCHNLRNKGLFCRRGCSIQRPWVPINFVSRFYQFSRIIQRWEVTPRWGGKEAIYRSRNFAHAAECVLPPMAAFPFFSPYSLLVKVVSSITNFFFTSNFHMKMLRNDRAI